MQFVEEQADKIYKISSSKEILQEVLAILKGQYWSHQTNHWQTNVYGNHLLFQRLYEGVQKEIDTLAEKLVGYFGEETVDQSALIEKTQYWVDKWNKTKDPVDRGLESEKDLQKAVSYAYNKLKNQDDLSLGLDDYLMALANAHETNLYLLGQINGRNN